MSAIRQSNAPTYIKPSRGVNNGTASPKSAEQLIKAARAGDIQAIEKELSSGVDVNGRWDGTTALLAATVSGQFEAVKYLLSKNAEVEARDNDGYTIFKLALDNNHRCIAEYIVKHYPNVTVTDPRLPEGEKWLREQFTEISKAVKHEDSKPRTEVLEYLVSGDLPAPENRLVSDVYWEHILLRYIGDVPLDIQRNYSVDLRLSLMGTFDTFLISHEGIKYSAWLLNSKLPSTQYEIKGTVVDEEGGWVTERWGYKDEKNITVEDGIDSFLIDGVKGKIMTKMINYTVQ
ncbi:hypothetical protein N8T08_010674 [Aspergillus melleus]|uniref:Uncharacterized protein n=1 Tax=Aspergillus melleus TaxID=138277 RepID=A0ACC3BBH0_9EURO|nr:hypothetical protein N8T08_010674 [Aspergillus melleus]